MCRLRREPRENLQLLYDFQEIKAMVEEDKDQNISPFQEGNTKAMMVLLLSRLLSLLSMNYAVNMFRVNVFTQFANVYFAPSLGFFARLLVFSLVSLFADRIGRKKLLLASGGIAGVCLLANTIWSIVLDGPSNIPGIITLIFDGAVGAGVAYIPDVIMSEAFPMKKKLASSMVACIMEYALQIIVVGILYNMALSQYQLPTLIVSTILYLSITAALYYLMPVVESNSTQRQAKEVYRGRTTWQKNTTTE